MSLPCSGRPRVRERGCLHMDDHVQGPQPCLLHVGNVSHLPPLSASSLATILNLSADPRITPVSSASGLKVVGTLQEAGELSLPASSGSTPLTVATPTTFGYYTSCSLKTSRKTATTSASTGTPIRCRGKGKTWLHWCATSETWPRKQ